MWPHGGYTVPHFNIFTSTNNLLCNPALSINGIKDEENFLSNFCACLFHCCARRVHTSKLDRTQRFLAERGSLHSTSSNGEQSDYVWRRNSDDNWTWPLISGCWQRERILAVLCSKSTITKPLKWMNSIFLHAAFSFLLFDMRIKRRLCVGGIVCKVYGVKQNKKETKTKYRRWWVCELCVRSYRAVCRCAGLLILT